MAEPPASMFHSRTHIQKGDIVIVYLNRTDHLALTMTPGKQLHNKYGRYFHDDMIGLPFGSKMVSPPPEAGYVYLLRPTPELWTKSLPHRTQILYQPDISYITMRLGVRAGGKVIEAGTGSGSMTHSLSRLVGPNGYVGSYEYHQTRYTKAKDEFESHGLTNVRLAHRNVCKDGFGSVTGVEAVFLDLPAPWEAIPHVMKVIRQDVIVKICCFSPCIEQVTKTCSALRAAGFGDVSTQEVLIRTYDLPAPAPPSYKPLRDITDIVAVLKTHEVKKAERRVHQMRSAREKLLKAKGPQAGGATTGGGALEGEGRGTAREAADGEGSAGVAAAPGETTIPAAAATTSESSEMASGKRKLDEAAEPDSADNAPKRARTAQAGTSASASGEDFEVDESSERNGEHVEGQEGEVGGDGEDAPDVLSPWTPPETPESTIRSQILLRIQPEMRGHTSYLTFATLAPKHIRDFLSGESTTSMRPDPSSAAKEAEGGAEASKGKSKGKGKEKEPGRVDVELDARTEASATHSATQTATETETEFADPELDNQLGTMTEEEMLAILSRD